MGSYRRRTASIQKLYKGTLRTSHGPGFFITVTVQETVVLAFSSLYRKDSLTCCRNDLICCKIPVDPGFQSKSLKPGRCQDQSTVLTLIQFPESCLKISTDTFDLHIRIQFLKLKCTSQTGTSKRFAFIQFGNSLRKYQYISWIFSSGKGQKGQFFRNFHRHIFQAVHRKDTSSIHQCFIQFLYKKSLSANLVQGAVQNDISGGFHGKDFHFHFRIFFFYIITNHFTLEYRKFTLPAANYNLTFLRLHHPAPSVPFPALSEFLP